MNNLYIYLYTTVKLELSRAHTQRTCISAIASNSYIHDLLAYVSQFMNLTTLTYAEFEHEQFMQHMA